MTRLQTLFARKKDILSVYFTAGYPKLSDTRLVIESLIASGVDLLEIGIPFSDPLADGPVIQRSSEVALENGMNLKLLFSQLKEIRKTTNDTTPLLLMGYLNPVLQFGVEAFCKQAQEAGIDGVILPDLPLQEYLDDYQELFRKYGLTNIFLVTPQTSEERIRLIDAHTDGFIYLVSAASTTGVKDHSGVTQLEYFSRVQSMKLKNPTLIGFGISDRSSFARACDYAHGAIIGSAFVKALEQSADLPSAIQSFVTNLRQDLPLLKN